MRSTVDPKVSVKVSRECSTIFKFVKNTNQVGQSMSRERNEHLVESEMEGSRKRVYIYIYIYIYIGTVVLKKKKRKKGTVVPVPLSSVPVPPTQKEAVAIWYWYHTYRYRYSRASLGQTRVFIPLFHFFFHTPTPPISI